MCGLVVTGCAAAPADITSLGAWFLYRLPETPGSSAQWHSKWKFQSQLRMTLGGPGFRAQVRWEPGNRAGAGQPGLGDS